MSSWSTDIKCPCCGSTQTSSEDHSTVIRGTNLEESSIACYNCGLDISTKVVEARIQTLEEVNEFRKDMGLRQLKKLAKPNKNFNINHIDIYKP